MVLTKSQAFIFIAQYAFDDWGIIFLQQVNRFFYRRVPQFIKVVKRKPTFRLSKKVYPNPLHTQVIEFPTSAKLEEYKSNGKIPYLIGFENNRKDGTGIRFNIILNNGSRTHRQEGYFTHFLPQDAYKITKSVHIYYNHDGCVRGFKFFSYTS